MNVIGIFSQRKAKAVGFGFARRLRIWERQEKLIKFLLLLRSARWITTGSVLLKALSEKKEASQFFLRIPLFLMAASINVIINDEIIMKIKKSSFNPNAYQLIIVDQLVDHLFANETLMEVDISSVASPYTFQELSDLPKSLSNLESLQLPWPISIDIPIHGNEGDDDGLEICSRPQSRRPKTHYL